MSSDNFDFECADGTIFPNLPDSTYPGIPLTKKYLEFRGHRPGPASEYTEYGLRFETGEGGEEMVDELVDEIVRLREARDETIRVLTKVMADKHADECVAHGKGDECSSICAHIEQMCAVCQAQITIGKHAALGETDDGC